VSYFSLGPELSLYVGTRPTAVLHAQAAADRKRKALLWGAALLLATPILLVTFRRRARPPAQGRGQGARALRPGVAGQPVAQAQPARGPRLPEKEAKLGRYQLIDRIGEGACAEVFTAVSQGAGGLRRSLVVKRLRAEMADHPGAVAHFTDEATLLSKLSHPNLVSVFESGEEGGTYFIAEEYIVGRDLDQLLRRLQERGAPPLSISAALYVIHEILAGLLYLHGPRPGQDAPNGFVHRDVSLRNVMVSRMGNVKLLDFRITRADQRPAQAEIGRAMGSVDFMSPEQARGRAVDHRSDLFSVGLLLYHCAAREPLYRGDTQYDRVSRAAHGPGAQELARITALPPPLPALLTRALEIHPDRRFQSAAEFLTAVAPHIDNGEDEVAGLVSDLFADELQREIDRLSAGSPEPGGAGRPDRRLG
jgi:serine/threonine-protein kinase